MSVVKLNSNAHGFTSLSKSDKSIFYSLVYCMCTILLGFMVLLNDNSDCDLSVSNVMDTLFCA